MEEGKCVLTKEQFMKKVLADRQKKIDKRKRLEAEKKSYIMNKVIGAAVYRRKHRP